MSTEIIELPPVAHIVAELDDYHTSEFDVGMLPIGSWISPSGGRKRTKGFRHSIAMLLAPALGFR